MALLLLAVVVDAAFQFYERWRVGRMLALVQQIRIGVTTEAQFLESEKTLLRYTGLHFVRDNQGSVTEISHTEYGPWLFNLHLAQWELVQVGIRFEGGLAIERYGLFFTPGFVHPESAVMVHERVHGRPGSMSSFHHLAYFEKWGNPGNRIRVEDDEQAPDSDKRADWDFNLACMTSIAGCYDSHEILPQVRLTPLLQMPNQQ